MPETSPSLPSPLPFDYPAIEARILAGLGVDPSMLSGDTRFSSFSARMRVLTGKVNLQEYLKEKLPSEMRKYRGKKRLRKKKAKQALAMRWRFLQFGRAMSRRIDYSSIVKNIFVIQPLPQGALPIYDKSFQITEAIVGGGEEAG